MAIQNVKKTNPQPAEKKRVPDVKTQWADDNTAIRHNWEDDQSEQLVAALRAFFLTHTLDPLTGEVHTVH